MRVAGLRVTEILPSGTVHKPECGESVWPAESGCAPMCPPKECCEQCPPKVRLRDYIRVKAKDSETCITFAQPGECDPDLINAARTCMTASLRRRGTCGVLTTLSPLRATLDGAACFHWGIDVWQHGNGHYEMDISFNGVCCATVGVLLLGCDLFMLAYTTQQHLDCVVVPACAVPIDDEPAVTTGQEEFQEC